jgi:hypothetical protein
MLIGFEIIGFAFYSFLTKQFLPSLDCNLIFGFPCFSLLSSFFPPQSCYFLFRIELNRKTARIQRGAGSVHL